MKRFKTAAKKGFTLAEMLIVVAILAILTAVAAPNVAKYSKGIKLRELDDSARAIYMAAQHEFKAKVAMGKDLTADDLIDTPPRYTEDGAESIEKISYTLHSKNIPNGGIISTGAIESELAANNYVIEFNAETGDVYGVFYSVDPNEFEHYSDEYNNPAGKYAAAVSKSADRVATLGYYGLENEAIVPPPSSAEVPSPKVEIINREKLVLKVTAPNFSNKENKAYIAIDICDANDKDKIVHLVPRDGVHYMSPNGKADVILDSLEPSVHAISNELAGKAYEGNFSSWADGSIAPGAMLNISVTFYDPDGVAIDRTVKVTANSLFADGSDPTEAHIQYGRHLQNLGVPGASTSVKTVKIDKTIDFKAPGDGKEYDSWDVVYGYAKKFFKAVTTSAISISAAHGAQIRYLNAEGGGIFESLQNANVEGLELVNANVSGSNCGAIAAEASGGSFKNCCAYVENSSGESWTDLEKNPYKSYTINGTGTAGGLVGEASNVEFNQCSSSVKVIGNIAGGLIGSANDGTVTDCAVLGHTYSGKFEGKTAEGKDVDLKDNVSGSTAGGIIGKADGSVEFIGTVFSSCSVAGTNANPICPNIENINISGDQVYTLGKAYDLSGIEIVKIELPTHALNADSAPAGAHLGYRYDCDNNVSPIFRYRAPDGVTLRGDWPSSDTSSGFFYWEKEGENYNIYAIMNGVETGEICKDRDGNVISEYGYGAFSSGSIGTVSFKKGEDNVRMTELTDETADETTKKTLDSVKAALSAKGLATNSVILYSGNARGFVTATFDGASYTFAPNFYALYPNTPEHDTLDYGVRCKAHLENIRNYLEDNTAKFVQSHDIKPGKIEPIGSKGNPFKGSYDGRSYRIIDAQIIAKDGDYAGLFGATDGAKLKNIVLFHPAEAASDFVALTVKESGLSTVRSMNPVGISALNGAMMNESLAAVDGTTKAAGLTLPYTNTVNNGSLFCVFTPDDVRSLIEQYGSTGADIIFHFEQFTGYMNLQINNDPNNVWNNATQCQVEKIDSDYIVPISVFKEKATNSDGTYCYVWIQTNNYTNTLTTLTYTISASTDPATPTDPSECKDHTCDGWTYKDESEHTGTCTKCGATVFGYHHNNGTWTSDTNAHWRVCTDCHGQYSRENHTNDGSWQHDNLTHWHVCPTCGAKFATGNHDYSNPGSAECSICGYKIDGGSGSGSNGGDSGEPGGDVQTSPAKVGGIVGKADGGSISNCVVAGYTLTGTECVGGIAGESTCAISDCEANVKFGKISGGRVGGIVGSGSMVQYCYALVHGIDGSGDDVTLGGIAGKATRVENCYVIFAGQTVGKPVADGAVSGSYYISDEGYYQGAETDGGTATTLAELSGKLPAPFGAAAKTYTSSVTATSDNYAYPAVFLADGVEHYGPTEVKKGTKAISGEVVTGPLVGLYNLRQTTQGDLTFTIGYLSYNRNGKLYSNEFYNGNIPFDIATTELRGRYIGIFLEKDASQEGLSYYVTNNDETSNAILVPFNEIYKAEMHYSSNNVMFYTTQGNLTVSDLYRWEDENNWHNSDVNTRFKYYVLCDKENKKPLPIYNDTSIDVEYTDPKTGKTGNILHAQGPLFKTEFIKTALDDKPIPEVTIFRSAPFIDYNNGSKVCTDKQVYDDTFVTQKTDSTKFGNLWVMLPAEYKDDIENGNIRFLYCNELMSFDESEIRYWQSEKDGNFGDSVNNQFVPITIPDDKIIVHLASGKAKMVNGETEIKDAHNWFKIDVLFGTRTIASKGIDKWSGQEIKSIKELKTQDEYTPMVGIFNRKLKSSGDGAFQMVFNENGVVYSNADDAYVKNYNEIVTKVYGVFMLMGDQPYVSGVSVFVDGKAQEISLEDYTKSISETWRQYDFKGNDGSATQKKFEKTYTLYQLDDPKISPDSDIKVYIGDELMLDLKGSDIGA